MTPQPSMVVCCRVKDKPIGVNVPGTTIRLCAHCWQDVLLAPSSQKVLCAMPTTIIICNDCAKKEYDAGKKFRPVMTMDAVKEVEAIEKAKDNN